MQHSWPWELVNPRNALDILKVCPNSEASLSLMFLYMHHLAMEISYCLLTYWWVELTFGWPSIKSQHGRPMTQCWQNSQ